MGKTVKIMIVIKCFCEILQKLKNNSIYLQKYKRCITKERYEI